MCSAPPTKATQIVDNTLLVMFVDQSEDGIWGKSSDLVKVHLSTYDY